MAPFTATISGRTITTDSKTPLRGNLAEGGTKITWKRNDADSGTWTKLGTLYIIHHKNSNKTVSYKSLKGNRSYCFLR